jgi:hypothetical protein
MEMLGVGYSFYHPCCRLYWIVNMNALDFGNVVVVIDGSTCTVVDVGIDVLG